VTATPLSQDKVRAILSYIARNWERTYPADKPRPPVMTPVPCPHFYTTPNFDGMLQYPFYWDTYFTNVGLLLQGRSDLALSNIETLTYYLHRCGRVPNINFPAGMNRSQPPFLSMMVCDQFKISRDRDWLARMEHALKFEYLFWMTERITPIGLNRFFHNATEQELVQFFDAHLESRLGAKADSDQEKIAIAAHYCAEAESGADFTSRFEGRCADYASLELNCNLYQYEKNFAWMACQFGRSEEGGLWAQRAAERAKRIQKYFWSDKQGGFYDYNFVEQRHSSVLSPVAFCVLWRGLATGEQADKMRAKLLDLECEWGVAATDKVIIPRNLQWDAPRGWPPHFYMAVSGLKQYGFEEDARRLQEKYLSLNIKLFGETGQLWEKFDVVKGEKGVAEYGVEPQMGWTAGVFVAFADDLGL
jgi:alpha,alpha-trehalase